MIKNFGALLKEIRVKNGITLMVFAERCKISSAMISNFEHNRARPTEKILWQMLEQLNATEKQQELLFTLSVIPLNPQQPKSALPFVPLVGRELPCVALRLKKNRTKQQYAPFSEYYNQIPTKQWEVC